MKKFDYIIKMFCLPMIYTDIDHFYHIVSTRIESNILHHVDLESAELLWFEDLRQDDFISHGDTIWLAVNKETLSFLKMIDDTIFYKPYTKDVLVLSRGNLWGYAGTTKGLAKYKVVHAGKTFLMMPRHYLPCDGEERMAVYR